MKKNCVYVRRRNKDEKKEINVKLSLHFSFPSVRLTYTTSLHYLTTIPFHSHFYSLNLFLESFSSSELTTKPNILHLHQFIMFGFSFFILIIIIIFVVVVRRLCLKSFFFCSFLSIEIYVSD